MDDYIEIDFLSVDSAKSGDAITLRYRHNGLTRIHVVDGGFQKTGESLVEHINSYYDYPTNIDAVVVTHNDGDHTGGLETILNTFKVGELWMLRPWVYSEEVIGRVQRYRNPENLAKELKSQFKNLGALEDIALEKGIPIKAPFQGEKIGIFEVVSPTKEFFLDMVMESEKSPALVAESSLPGFLKSASEKVASFIKAVWGDENFSGNETSPDNEMSIVQYCKIANKKIMLTGDAGRQSLAQAILYMNSHGLTLPIDWFQVPHHGSRRNLNSVILDQLLGVKMSYSPNDNWKTYSITSASKGDEDHPRRAVIRALYHRHCKPSTTENGAVSFCAGAISVRPGWGAVPAVQYPNDQEE